MVNNSSVKTNGVAQNLPENPIYFTQISIPEILTIPDQKPDIEELVSVTVQAEVAAYNLIDTPCMKSFEGQLLSGKKLILELKIIEKIVYVADEPTQTNHAAHFENTMKSIFIVVPQEIEGTSMESLFNQNRIEITPYIEDIYVLQRDKRTIFKNLTMLIDVTLSC
ncbi:hypothetical protein [Pontibacillus sp. HMF3514]|uniref:hypothetical protein n=1 Tax=Pontibacillus sp. HMF3514 TaxID=2692425 RepID=UPI00131FB42B|nr:hypothetical protein [Pontibacillus sp. HMF3514]QHE54120.1 hypothetical protein GS400_19760 [Pontibacillus sp. HMF3514]